MIETKTVSRIGIRSLPAYAQVHRWAGDLRAAEAIAIGYFCYTLALCLVRGIGPKAIALAASLPILIFMLASLESAHSRPWTRVCRGLFPTALILAAYWRVDWFRGPAPLQGFQ